MALYPLFISATDDPIHFMFGYMVFGDSGSNGAIYGSNKSKMAAAATLEKFQMAISPQPVVRLHFMFGYRVGFSGTADLTALFSIRTNLRWRPPPSCIISNGHISATASYIAHIARPSLR